MNEAICELCGVVSPIRMLGTESDFCRNCGSPVQVPLTDHDPALNGDNSGGRGDF